MCQLGKDWIALFLMGAARCVGADLRSIFERSPKQSMGRPGQSAPGNEGRVAHLRCMERTIEQVSLPSDDGKMTPRSRLLPTRFLYCRLAAGIGTKRVSTPPESHPVVHRSRSPRQPSDPLNLARTVTAALWRATSRPRSSTDGPTGNAVSLARIDHHH